MLTMFIPSKYQRNVIHPKQKFKYFLYALKAPHAVRSQLLLTQKYQKHFRIKFLLYSNINFPRRIPDAYKKCR